MSTLIVTRDARVLHARFSAPQPLVPLPRPRRVQGPRMRRRWQTEFHPTRLTVTWSETGVSEVLVQDDTLVNAAAWRKDELHEAPEWLQEAVASVRRTADGVGQPLMPMTQIRFENPALTREDR